MNLVVKILSDALNGEEETVEMTQILFFTPVMKRIQQPPLSFQWFDECKDRDVYVNRQQIGPLCQMKIEL